MDNSINNATVGFCISERFGIYIANNSIVGLRHHRMNGRNIITLYTSYHSFIIYEHADDYLNFETVSKKIITKIMNNIRYNIDTNIMIDEIIDEVIKYV